MYAAFHHLNAKGLYTDPVDVLDENKGINVNNDTHKEIHKQNIRTADELKKNSASIKETVDLPSKMAPIFKFVARGL